MFRKPLCADPKHIYTASSSLNSSTSNNTGVSFIPVTNFRVPRYDSSYIKNSPITVCPQFTHARQSHSNLSTLCWRYQRRTTPSNFLIAHSLIATHSML
ncbi:uncharacterized protein PHALS_14982 [Plasmopara halstedii]|uniref:Uncharacterized protein n=1 Tax=Plasmopara halstedii TaxID=4781 RepID=A0A0P1A9N6_PLAHL|nr:uncharacterized protein PHALS_14982 [Plasmopara halstedii]CEG36797.1 hypothetical protein PHALS_14982 [Plasmopara halstedii]|eukprot:XP_024573166.1 hypothetical protein PHALS_14982 [Plasmopara halstedii]